MNQQKVSVLSNLRPETLLGIESVPFQVLAMAMPGVIDVSFSIGDVPFIGKEGDEIDVKAQVDIEPDCEERMVVTERYIVVGGLCYDRDGSHCDPLEEGTANGAIFHRGRRGVNGEEADFYKAIGYDQYGSRDLDAEPVLDRVCDMMTSAIRKNRSVMTTLSNFLRAQGKPSDWNSVLKRLTDAVHYQGLEYALHYVAEWFIGVSHWYELDDAWQEKLEPLAELLDVKQASPAWEAAVRDGALGTPLSVLLDIYEHSGIAYSVAGTGMNCRWDTTGGGAVWVPCAEAQENIRYKVLHQMGCGEVKWFGALGSLTDPLNARYSTDGGRSWLGNFSTWEQAVDSMLAASGRSIDEAMLSEMMAEEARRYCKGILESYNAWRNGEVYGVAVYVIDRETGERIENHDDVCWGHLGSQYAEETLEQSILSKVVQLVSPH